ncbi:5'-3' exoribonuclease 1 isoform X2 [Erpetoichthys calabaricus]|uniref:5'-3' exoribonuclease 1 isoform X2 n=1 Tax=Erpetoichthys calabaricus TaxID=27687 RepID=UPI00109F480F|nr:5'-3' exoribonuclease 1 isoform X2 [Erpetoichthys calabaricus]
MGVPKFYRWISERYPCLSEVVKEHQIPEFDNLYLDMNGIIHQCSHPNDEDVHFRISEEKIFTDIFHYLEVLFRIIKPRKVFFMAVDGVAPRAKMNQQRGRRFRSAKEAEEKIKKAVEKGETLPTEARFDSNCITPGTEFMARLHEQLKYFVNNKITTDKSWQGVKVFLSGHETPGEGEHKIMEFIRSEKAKPNHDPNTRHCLYGLDADLIMLGLTSHEPHFSLLREEVRFGGKKSQKRITAPEETTFHLLHLSLMREYIDYEFSILRKTIPFHYDLERIIDDWILMGFLVGNDFIPHLPHLHINHDALPLLYRTYISVLPKLGGYINENGNLNLNHFEKYLGKLSEFDREHFSEVFVDLKWFESKVGNKYLNEAAGMAAEEARNHKGKRLKKQEDALCLAAFDGNKEPADVPTKELPDDETDEDLFETEFRQYKRTYYMTKMGVEVVSDEFLANQAECYVQAIQWILHYYYHGVQSWSWYYPYHYAPYLSDIRGISTIKLEFTMGKPFMPFEQLLAVLPAASKDLLPICYQNLMTSENSPIFDYYPLEFKTDLNGKQQEWEAVVLIPFIDEKRLLAAMEPCNNFLTEEEKQRNRHSACAAYWFDKELEFYYPSPLPKLFPSVQKCHARSELIPMDAWHVDVSYIGNKVDNSALYFCGFPTLKHIKHSFFLKKAGVQVFQQSSRGENMMLEITLNDQKELISDDVASLVLGKSVFVNWPHLEEARVVAVSDGETKFYLDEPPGIQKLYSDKTVPPTRVVYLNDKEESIWMKEVQGITEFYHKRKGIIINETAVLLFAQLLTGRKYVLTSKGDVVLEKQWSKQILPFAYQATVNDIVAFDSSFCHYKTVDELFSPSTTVFMLGNTYYGAMGEVQDSADVVKEGRIRVLFTVPCEPQLEALMQNQHKYSVKYSPGYVLASRLGISPYLVSRFSGSIFVARGSRKNQHGEQKSNIGLNLKFNKKNEEVPGYTKKSGNEWLYSVAVEELLAEYLERFSEVFNYVSKNNNEDIFYEDDIWPGQDENGAEKVEEIITWLKTNPVSSCSRASCDLQVLDAAIILKIEEEVEKCKLKRSNKKVRVTVKPHLLYRPLEQQYGIIPDKDADYRLFDRVVNVRDCFTVPLGLRGTVTGIKGADRESEILYEVIFDEEFAGGLTIRCSPGRGYRLSPSALINLSHGYRLEYGGQKLTAIVKPQQQPAAAYFSTQKVQIGGLNHSPRSPFVPTKLNGKQQCNPKSENQINWHGPQRMINQKNIQKDKDDEYSNVWHSLQMSGNPRSSSQLWEDSSSKHGSGGGYQTQNTMKTQQRLKHEHSVAQGYSKKYPDDDKGHYIESSQQTVRAQTKQNPCVNEKPTIRLLKKSEDISDMSISQTPGSEQISTVKVSSEFQDLMASVKISNASDSPSAQFKDESSKEPLSPQSFAMQGTLVLKEMLKIEGSSSAQMDKDKTTPTATAPSSSSTNTSHPTRRRSTKKLAAHINKPQVSELLHQNHTAEKSNQQQGPLQSTLVVELSRICAGLNLSPPDFGFLKTPQGMTVCQVKLSNGLLVHGPQCLSENEAKEKAALFALQRLSSIGPSFPLPPHVFSNVQQMRPAVPSGPIPAIFGQHPRNLMMHPNPHAFGPICWGAPIQIQGPPFYKGPFSGNRLPTQAIPVGTHNQFVPLQVTKKRVSNKKNYETKESAASEYVKTQRTEHADKFEVLNSVVQTVCTPSVPTATPQASIDNQDLKDSKAPFTPRQTRSHTTPSSSGRRKPRKLAVNFDAAKVTEQ